MINFQGPAKKETSTGRGFLEKLFSPLSVFNSKQKARPSSTYGAPPPRPNYGAPPSPGYGPPGSNSIKGTSRTALAIKLKER